MKVKDVLAGIVCISVILSSLIVGAYAATVSVTPTNIVLRDASGFIVGQFYAGASPPASPGLGSWYYSPLNFTLYAYNGTAWAEISTASFVDDDTMYVFINGTRSLSADWNVGAGLYSVTWINGTSVNISSQIWAQGLNRTDAVVNPVGSCSYIVDVVGSSYRMINQTTGQVDFYSTNASAVINNAIGNTTAGIVFLQTGTYVINYTLNVPTGVWLQGAGQAATILQCGTIAFTDVIYCTGSRVAITDLAITSATHVYGSLINWNASSSRTGIFQNLRLTSTATLGGYAFLANNSFNLQMDNIQIQTSGNGVGLVCTGPYNFGNCALNNVYINVLSTSNGTGLSIIGTSSYGMNLMKISNVDILTTGTYPHPNNLTAVYLRYCSHVEFDSFDIENLDVGWDMANSYFNTFNAVYYYSVTTQVASGGFLPQLDSSSSTTIVVNENVAVGDVLFHNSSGYFKANAVSSATLPIYGVYGIVTQAVSSGTSVIVVTSGLFVDTAWSWSVGSLYISNSTSGAMQQTYPSGSGEQSEMVAQAISTTTILFNPKSVISIP